MGGPFTPEELVLIQVANQASSFLGHHHHGHGHGHGHGHDHHNQHSHHTETQFKAPEKLTTQIGLYALKKLNTINPTFLRARQARLLDPVTPGTISYFINIGIYLASGTYGIYLWRTRGLRGFASVAVLPFLALIGSRYLTNQVLSYARDHFYYFQRKNLVNAYVQRYGEEFLLNSLNPSFRL